MSEDIPLKISYTDEDVANAAKRDKFREGVYPILATDIVRQVSVDNGHLMFKVSYRALKDAQDAGSTFGPTMYHYQCLPFRNPNRDGHVPNKFFAASTNRWLAAHMPEEVTGLPVRTEEGLFYKGEQIDYANEEESKLEAYGRSFEKASIMWEDESNEAMEAIKGTRVYAKLEYQMNKKTGQISDFPSLGNFLNELTGDEELVDPETAMTVEAVEVEEEEEEEEIPKKAIKPAANGKPTKNGKVTGKPAKATAGKKRN